MSSTEEEHVIDVNEGLEAYQAMKPTLRYIHRDLTRRTKRFNQRFYYDLFEDLYHEVYFLWKNQLERQAGKAVTYKYSTSISTLYRSSYIRMFIQKHNVNGTNLVRSYYYAKNKAEPHASYVDDMGDYTQDSRSYSRPDDKIRTEYFIKAIKNQLSFREIAHLDLLLKGYSITDIAKKYPPYHTARGIVASVKSKIRNAGLDKEGGGI